LGPFWTLTEIYLSSSRTNLGADHQPRLTQHPGFNFFSFDSSNSDQFQIELFRFISQKMNFVCLFTFLPHRCQMWVYYFHRYLLKGKQNAGTSKNFKLQRSIITSESFVTILETEFYWCSCLRKLVNIKAVKNYKYIHITSNLCLDIDSQLPKAALRHAFSACSYCMHLRFQRNYLGLSQPKRNCMQ